MPSKSRKLRPLPRIPKLRRRAVTRAEFDHVIDILNERGDILVGYRAALDEHHARLDQIGRELDTQLKRIAQLQAQLDRFDRKR
jgi:hypothetical protein